jgi:uncharacterized membrane protein YfcA
MTHEILIAVVGLVGGAFGSMVGLGGGVFIVPALTLFLHVPIHAAISASLLGIVATSATAASAYVRDNLTNLRVAVTLETMTASGALVGGFIGASLSRGVLSGIFGAVMIAVSIYLVVGRRSVTAPLAHDADLGRLGHSYFDRNEKTVVSYRVRRAPVGLGVSVFAGGIAGLLGVGGGFMKVPLMVLIMGIPVRAAVSTSSFMVGVTACASAVVFLARGLVDPTVAVPVVFGVSLGAYAGSKLAIRVRSSILTWILGIALFALSIQMLLSAFGVTR